MEVLVTKVFIPNGQYYGVRLDNVILEVRDVLDRLLYTYNLVDGTVVSGLGLKGVSYASTIDTSIAAGPYLKLTWFPEPSASVGITEATGKVPIIPPDYKVCIKFNSAVTDTSGNTMIARNSQSCYGITFDPFYAPIEFFRNHEYGLFSDMSDLELAKEIWMASTEADNETFCNIDITDQRYPYLNYIKQKYAMLKPLLRKLQMTMAGGGSVRKKLADLEIQVQQGGASTKDMFKDWLNELNELRRILHSCGELSIGTSLKPKSGRIGDLYDRSVFGRYVQGYLLDYPYYVIPMSRNHLFTDPYSIWWVK